METQSTVKPISKGMCAFCGSEIAKNKITQHLKSCKQRIATIAEQEEKSQGVKTHLFHILAEGRYNPQYWLHFEVPTSEPLWSVDSFLKAMWIDDLDHLSGFTINGTNYSNDYPDDFFSFEKVEELEEEELSEEEVQQELEEVIENIVAPFIKGPISYLGMPLTSSSPLSPEWIAEIKKPRSVDELVHFLKEELASIEKASRLIRKEKQDGSFEENRTRYMVLHMQKMLLEDLLEAVEDRSIDVELAHVLKVGQKFSYVYDYGSSTYINLKVVGEREGIVQNKEESVQLLARNNASAFPCVVCGKPATLVEMGYYTHDIANGVFCAKCGGKQDDDEGGMLPIINSPRAGVL